MKQPFIIKPLNKFNPNGVFGVGNQPTNTMLIATENINGVETVTQIKITDGVTNFSSLKNLISEGSSGGDSDSVPMSGIPADKFMQNTFVIGNTTANSVIGDEEYRTVINKGISYQYGDVNKQNPPYKDTASLSVSENNFTYNRTEVNQFYRVYSIIQATNYASVLQCGGFNDLDNEVKAGQVESSISSAKRVYGQQQKVSLKTTAGTQEVIISFDNPPVVGVSNQFKFTQEGGLESDKDFSEIVNPLSFVQKKYVDDKLGVVKGSIESTSFKVNNGNAWGIIKYEKIRDSDYITLRLDLSVQLEGSSTNSVLEVDLPFYLGLTNQRVESFNGNGSVIINTNANKLYVRKAMEDNPVLTVTQCFVFPYGEEITTD